MIVASVQECSRLIADKKWKIAFVESATAGRMCSEFALSEYAGNILRGGLSCYEVFVKEHILKVPHGLLEEFTPESAEVTEALARQAALLFESEITVAVTGLTKSGGSETVQKPVGTMFIYILAKEHSIAHREVFKGDAETIIEQCIDRTAKLIAHRLRSNTI